MYACVCVFFFWILFHYRLLQVLVLHSRSLLSVLYIIMCIRSSQTPNFSPPIPRIRFGNHKYVFYVWITSFISRAMKSCYYKLSAAVFPEVRCYQTSRDIPFCVWCQEPPGPHARSGFPESWQWCFVGGKSFPASGSFPMGQFFASGGQSFGVSASA